MTGDSYLGIDVGGGGIRVQALIGGQQRQANDRGPVPRAGGHVDVAGVAQRIGRLVAELDHGRRVDRVAVGLTGMPGLVPDPEKLADHVRGVINTSSVIIAGDSLTTHLGVLAGRPGCVVAAGTGVIILGTDHRRIWNRVDGWGHLLGDEGSGAWIGAAGLKSAFRHRDGRDGGSELLYRELCQRYGSIDGSIAEIYGAESPAHELSGFAPSVARAAQLGDPVAREIWHRAGIQLAGSAAAAVHGLPPNFSWGGRLFDVGRLLLEPFRAELYRRISDARLTEPAGQSADGALLLARNGIGPGHAPYAYEFC